MAGFSNFLADKILNEYFRDTAPSAFGTLYVALFSTLPVNAGTGGVELSAGNYARVGVPTTNAGLSAPASSGNNRQIDNSAIVDFGTVATADWAPAGTPCVGFGWFDALTSGNYLGGQLFGSSKVMQIGDPVRFNIGELDIVITRPSA